MPMIASFATTRRRLTLNPGAGGGSPGDGKPTARPDSTTAAVGTTVRIDLLVNDEPLGSIEVTNVGSPTIGTAILLDDKRNVDFTMPAGTPADTIAEFFYTIRNTTNSKTATAKVSVRCTDEPDVVARDNTYTTTAGRDAFAYDVLSNDDNSSQLYISAVSALSPARGSVRISDDKRSLIFTPPTTVTSVTPITCTYTARNVGGAKTGTATITWTVSPPAVGGKFKSGLAWASGMDMNSDGNLTEMALRASTDPTKGRGRPLDGSTLFIGGNFFIESKGGSWTKITSATANFVANTNGQAHTLIKNGYKAFVAVPLCMQSEAGQFKMLYESVAAGPGSLYYDRFAALAEIFKAWYGTDGQNLYLRLGWEADNGYPWSVTDRNNGRGIDAVNSPYYKPYWRAVAQIFKSKMPTVNLVWNCLRSPQININTYYPGDDIVDVIGVDVYDNSSGGWIDSDSAWASANAYNATTGTVKGPEGWLAFARAHGKKLSCDEWGATNKLWNENTNPNPLPDGSNNSYFVPKMFNFFANNAIDIEFESYFNGKEPHQIYPPTTWQPLPSAAYTACWSAPNNRYNYIYKPPSSYFTGVPDSDIVVWDIPTTGGVWPQRGTNNQILFLRAPLSGPITGTVSIIGDNTGVKDAYGNDLYTGVNYRLIIGVGFDLAMPGSLSSTFNGTRWYGQDVFRIQHAKGLAMRPSHFIGNIKYDSRDGTPDNTFGDFLQLGTTPNSAPGTPADNFADWCDSYICKIWVFGHYGFTGENRTGDTVPDDHYPHSDFRQMKLGGVRNLYLSEADIAWNYQTEFVHGADIDDDTCHPQGRSFYKKTVMRPLPQKTALYSTNSGYRQPIYWANIGKYPDAATATAQVTAGNYYALVFEGDNYAIKYGGSGKDVASNYFGGYNGITSRVTVTLTGNIASFTAYKGTAQTYNFVSGTVTFEEPATPVVKLSELGRANSIRTVADLKAVFG